MLRENESRGAHQVFMRNRCAYCEFVHFRENFIFVNSVERDICHVKKSRLGHDVSTVKPVISDLSKRAPKIGLQYRLSLIYYADQKYCRMLQGEHSAMLSTFIRLPFSVKTLVLSIFEWLLKTGFTVHQ